MKKVRTKNYQVQWKDLGECWEMTLFVRQSHSHTKYFDSTYEILHTYLPCILNCECDNTLNLPFAEEVKQTEMGHLLEHILLEYLCQEKLTAGSVSAEFTGRTYWNIKQRAHTEFQIIIEKNAEDSQFFSLALKKSLHLLDKIFQCGSNSKSNVGSDFSLRLQP